MRIDLFEFGFQGLGRKTSDVEHGRGLCFASVDGVGNDGGLDGKNGEILLATKSAVEEPFDSLDDVGGKGVEGFGSGDGDGRNGTLRAACPACETRTELAWVRLAMRTVTRYWTRWVRPMRGKERGMETQVDSTVKFGMLISTVGET